MSDKEHGPARVTLAHDVRRWTTFHIKDATEAELDILTDDDETSMRLLKRMEKDGRLKVSSVEVEDTPDLFSEGSHPSVINAEFPDSPQ